MKKTINDKEYSFVPNANLKNANLKGAALKNACFRNAILYGANLQGADLSKAFFAGSNFRWLPAFHSLIFGTHFDQAAMGMEDGSTPPIHSKNGAPDL